MIERKYLQEDVQFLIDILVENGYHRNTFTRTAKEYVNNISNLIISTPIITLITKILSNYRGYQSLKLNHAESSKQKVLELLLVVYSKFEIISMSE